MNRTQLLKRQIKLSGKSTNFNWFNEQHSKRRLTIKGSAVTNEIFNQFRIAVRCTNEIFEDLWDIELEVRYNSSTRKLQIDILAIVIRFPEVTLTNNQSASHTVKELFVKVPLYRSGSMLKIESLEGGRMQLTYPEWSSQYLHSHLRRNNLSSGQPPFYGAFCTGSGHINDLISNVNGDGLNETRFTSFLVQIISLASWESIEGTPYIYMREIFVRNQNSSGQVFSFNSQLCTRLKDRIIEHHKTNNIIPQITYELEGEKYTIKDDDKFEAFLQSIPFSEEDKRRFLCMKDESGTYYRYGGVPRNNRIPPVIINKYLFKGQDMEFSITDAPEDTNRNIVYFIHPLVKEHIKQELEYDTNIKKIRKSTIDRYSS